MSVFVYFYFYVLYPGVQENIGTWKSKHEWEIDEDKHYIKPRENQVACLKQISKKMDNHIQIVFCLVISQHYILSNKP